MLSSEQHLRRMGACVSHVASSDNPVAVQNTPCGTRAPTTAIVRAIVVERARALPQAGDEARVDDVKDRLVGLEVHCNLAATLDWGEAAVDHVHNFAKAT